MSNKYTFLDLAEDVLSKSDRPLTVKAIWENAVLNGLYKKINSYGKTPDQTLGARLYTDVKEENSKFMIVSKKPTLFQLSTHKVPSKEEIDDFLADEYKKSEKDNLEHERSYHQVLTNFLSNCSLGCIHTKTIFHEVSKKGKKGQDKWNYPDIVGVGFAFGNYTNSTIDLMQKIQYPVCKLYSFELKKSLDFGNYKESYFQAVSNSSWANEGYLVVVDIDEEVKLELKRLCDAFGIGLMRIDIANIEDSEIIYPAKIKNILDMATIDLLIDKNNDFKIFIDTVNSSMQLSKIVDEVVYDKVLTDDELNKYILKLKTKNDEI